jgi:hypothetical protein
VELSIIPPFSFHRSFDKLKNGENSGSRKGNMLKTRLKVWKKSFIMIFWKYYVAIYVKLEDCGTASSAYTKTFWNFHKMLLYFENIPI